MKSRWIARMTEAAAAYAEANPSPRQARRDIAPADVATLAQVHAFPARRAA